MSFVRSKAISKSGTVFFSSLCVGTFSLGCWQSKRYFEKIEEVEQRKHDLQKNPIPFESNNNKNSATTKSSSSSFRRYKVKGKFCYKDQVFIGPRGPPLDVLGKTGPNSGRSGGGMGVSPQGYFIITPFEREDGDGDDNSNKEIILVNRGWIPQHFIKQPIAWEEEQDHSKSTSTVSNKLVEIVGVQSAPEKPGFFIPTQATKSKDNTLLYMEEQALLNATNTNTTNEKDEQQQKPLVLFVETSDIKTDTADNKIVKFPVKPNAETVGEFKVMPITHGTYAFTWFGLAGAGMVMTRKLITKGRW